jgi:hypothetical protein
LRSRAEAEAEAEVEVGVAVDVDVRSGTPDALSPGAGKRRPVAMAFFLSPCLLALALAVSGPTRAAPLPATPELHTGDLVFQTSRSAQSDPIARATHSRWTHVGLVEVGRDGPVVIEALGKVSRTPWEAFRRRGRGEVLVLRPRELAPAPLEKVAREAEALLGRPYDARFEWGDDRIYCSELVVKAYERGAGVVLGKRQRLGELDLRGLEPAIRKRWGRVPRELVLVTPVSLAADPALALVYRGR